MSYQDQLRITRMSKSSYVKKDDNESLDVERSVFESLPDSTLYDYRMALDKLKGELSKFGLTSNQSKVYIYLGKHGHKTAPEVCKALRLPRTETYYLLTTLQNKGIVSANFRHPTRFSAMPLDKAMWSLVHTEKERLRELERKERDLVELWDGIPDFTTCMTIIKEDKFQMLQGMNQIYGKIKEMISKPKELMILGSEKDFLGFYHSDLLAQLDSSRTDLKLLSSSSEKSIYVFDEVDRKSVRMMPNKINERTCFIVKDDDEVLLFMRNSGQSAEKTTAMWTDATSMIYLLKLLFNYIWSASKSIYPTTTTYDLTE